MFIKQSYTNCFHQVRAPQFSSNVDFLVVGTTIRNRLLHSNFEKLRMLKANMRTMRKMQRDLLQQLKMVSGSCRIE